MSHTCCFDVHKFSVANPFVEFAFGAVETKAVIMRSARREAGSSLDSALDDSEAGRGMDAWEFIKQYRARREDLARLAQVTPEETELSSAGLADWERSLATRLCRRP